MALNSSSQCPKCGRPLQKFNGRIGYCSQHKWVSPLGLGFDAEASEQNRQDAAAAESKRLEAERQKAEAERKVQQEQHAASVRKAVLVVAALCVVAAAIVFFIVRPSLNYNSAMSRFEAGEYESAQAGFTALGSYKDSVARVALCEAMIDLQNGNTEETVNKLDELTADGESAASRQLAEALLPMMAEWRQKGLSPEAMLLLLNRADIIDPEGTLDTETLNIEVHTALLGGNVINSYTEDIDGNGQPELIALSNDYSVAIYRMAGDGNSSVASDNATLAKCEQHFGNGYVDNDIDKAIACFNEAYRLDPQEDHRSALSAAYRQRSAERENSGEMEAAIEDAHSALDTSGSADDFSFYYDLNLRNCKSGNDAATAVAMWEKFAENNVAEITRFEAKGRWADDAAQLHLALASQYAAQRNEKCVDEIRTAYGMGADVRDALKEAESHFDPGLPLVRIRLAEIELLGTDTGEERRIRSEMATEVRTAISEWKSRGIAPQDAIQLIYLADEQDIDLTGIDVKKLYEEAAQAFAGAVAQSNFVDWDGNGYEELLTIDEDGIMSLYGMNEEWTVVSMLDTKLPGSSYTIVDQEAPLLIILSEAKDEFLAVTGTSDNLKALFRETGISRYSRKGTDITYSRLLEGSIDRYDEYAYEVVGIQNRPVRTGIDWQQSDYPMPESGAAAIERWFETLAYDIPEERMELTAGEAAEAFTLERMDSLPAPAVPGTVEASAYWKGENEELFEVSYSVRGQDVRIWMATVYDGGWKVAGAADTYGIGLDPNEADYAVPLLSLNAETTDVIKNRGGKQTYRMLLPTSGRLSLMWQAGEKKSSNKAFNVSLYRESLADDPLITYELQPDPSRQQTREMFMSAGVYYVEIEARTGESMPYSLTLSMAAADHIELESNDSSTTATQIEAETPYTGSLLTSSDVDWYVFSLGEAGAVEVEIGTSGKGEKSTVYSVTVYASDGKTLTTLSVPGNVLTSSTGNLYLAAGSYWIQVAKGRGWTNEAYSVTVKTSQNGVMEAERNDTLETANAIPVNEDIHATIGQEGDVDCYSFELDTDSILQPRFTFDPLENNSKTYVLTIYGGNRTVLLQENIGGKESTKVIAPVPLKAGSYTLKVENPQYIRQEYTLHLVLLPVDMVEQEPNDSAALATDLTLGTPVSGVLTTESDVDYYKVVITEQMTGTLRFSFTQTTNTRKVFTIAAEQNGKSQTIMEVTGDSGGKEVQLQFAPGEYYMKVKKGNAWSGAVYTVGLE